MDRRLEGEIPEADEQCVLGGCVPGDELELQVNDEAADIGTSTEDHDSFEDDVESSECPDNIEEDDDDEDEDQEEGNDDNKRVGESSSSSVSSVAPSPVHPTKTRWTLWLEQPGQHGNGGHDDWMQNLVPVNTFGSVEDFWRLFNNIKPPSFLPKRSNYHLFREGIKPMWEDVRNKQGGRWRMELKEQRDLDNIWMNAAVATIGECYEHSEEVCGIVAGPRPKFMRIAIWTRDWKNEAGCVGAGRAIKEYAKSSTPMEYQSHEAASNSSYHRDRKNSNIYKC